jgi:hypothetical protein
LGLLLEIIVVIALVSLELPRSSHSGYFHSFVAYEKEFIQSVSPVYVKNVVFDASDFVLRDHHQYGFFKVIAETR